MSVKFPSHTVQIGNYTSKHDKKPDWRANDNEGITNLCNDQPTEQMRLLLLIEAD